MCWWVGLPPRILYFFSISNKFCFDNELIENALKKYKESRGESIEKVSSKEIKERIDNKLTVNQPIK